MISRYRIPIGLAFILALVSSVPALAGGWAVISLDRLPSGVVVGEPVIVGFTVLQHGRTPMTDLEPTITATLSKVEQFVVNAKVEGKPGHYTATLTFPAAGEWNWSIQAFTMDQPMPVLSVAAPAAEAAKKVDPAQSSSTSALWIVRALIIGIGAISLIIAVRRKRRLAYAGTAVCLLIGLGSFATGVGPSVSTEAQAESRAETMKDESVSQIELGRQLFVAKGCITCHANRRIENDHEYWTIDMGATDLTNFSARPEVLFIRLKDPAAAKSDTKMPNLGLKEVEIEALIAFINSK